MPYTAEQLAADFLHLNIEQTSRLAPSDWVEKNPPNINPWVMSRDKVRRAGMGSYLILQAAKLAPSFPTAMKKIAKAGVAMNRLCALEPVMVCMLLDALVVDRAHSVELMGYVHQCLKTHGREFCRMVEHHLETRRINFTHGDVREFLNGLEVNRDTVGLYASMLLLDMSKDAMSAVRDKQLEDLREILIKPIFEPSEVLNASAASHALRPILKHSTRGAKMIAMIVGAQLTQMGPDQELGADATGFIKQIFEDQAVVEATVFQIAYRGFELMHRTKGQPVAPCAQVASALSKIGAVCNKQHLDNSIVAAMKTISRSSRFETPDRGKGGGSPWGELVMAIMGAAHNSQACWWSILNQQHSINNYLNLQKSKNTLLRSALTEIGRSQSMVPFLARFAELAIREHYHERSINMLVHAMPDGQKVLKEVYQLVGDQSILERMENGTRRDVLIQDLDL